MKNRDMIWKPGLIFLTTVILFIFIAFFHNIVGEQSFIFTIIPVALTALFFGLWPGLLMETIIIFMSFVLIAIIYRISLIAAFNTLPPKNIIGLLSHYGLVALLGYMHNQHKTIKRLNEEIIWMSKIDVLTNLYNRRALLEAAEQEFIQTIRNLSDVSAFMKPDDRDESVSYNRKKEINFKKKRELDDYLGVFACVIFDIDFFKRVNDTYGHLMGDTVLQKIGEILTTPGNLRKSDIFGRYGGEEFLILFPGTSARNSIYAVERLTQMIKEAVFTTRQGITFSITISTGISQYKKGDKDINDIIHRADEALYYAKHHGRDMIIVFEEQFKDREK